MPQPARPRVRFSRRSVLRPLIAAAFGTFLLGAGGGCAALPAGPPPWGGPPTPQDPVGEDHAAVDDGPDEVSDGKITLAGAEGPAGDSPFYESDPPKRPAGGKKPGALAKTRRWLNNLTGAKGAADVSAARLPPEARRAFERARNDLERGANDEAAAAFKVLSRRYADTAIEEDALFYRAEALYAEQRFAPAQDAYDTLLDRYPSTRRLDMISKRQFAISRRWLGFPEAVVGSHVKPVSYAEVAAGTPTPPPAARFAADAPPRSPDPTIAIPVLPNFHDKTRPLFDTTGRALNGLKNVWLNDPTGDLADDALMLSAGHHLRRGDYMEAGRLYDILRREYPDSPHVKDAYLLGAHAREVVWQGPVYDDKGLKESRQIKESFLRLFPGSADRDRVRESLANMAEAEAESDWALLQLYQRKGLPNSVAMYARKLIVEHAGSRAAVRARAIWDDLPAEAKALAGPLPAANPGYVYEGEGETPMSEPSVRPPAGAADRRPDPIPSRAATRESFDPDPLPASTREPRDLPPAGPSGDANPFGDSDPFSGLNPSA